jgi:hypothetical protein
MTDESGQHTTNGSVDPITLEVIRHGIKSSVGATCKRCLTA